MSPCRAWWSLPWSVSKVTILPSSLQSGRRPGAAGQRRVLGDKNDSVIRGNNTPAAFNPTLTSIDSVSFFKVRVEGKREDNRLLSFAFVVVSGGGLVTNPRGITDINDWLFNRF